MRIAIVDDEKPQAELIEKYARAWAEGRRLRLAADIFTSAEAFLFAWAEDRNFDLLLLDIQMEAMGGMELAHTLRQGGHTLPIVFVTGYPDFIEEGYDVEALHYLMKPVNREKLFACLDRACAKAESDSYILIETTGGAQRVPQRAIVCVEAFAHDVELVTMDTALRLRQSIGALWDALDAARFVRPHRSYIVGLQYIRQIGRDELVLDNGARVPVSRRRYDQINRAFIGFYRGSGK